MSGEPRTTRMTDDEPPVLAASGLGRQGRGGVWLFRHVNLEVRLGDRWAVQGPSGSGKTQLLRALAQLDRHDEGTLTHHGRPVTDSEVPEFRSRVLYVHQQVRFVEGTVRSNLQLPYRLLVHRNRSWLEPRVLKWLGQFGREARFLDKPVDELSGGESQMISLLRALQLDPEVLLLDEPTAAMDAATSSAVEQMIGQWCDESPRRATVWVTHRPQQARRMGRRLLRLEHGEVTYTGELHADERSQIQDD